MVNTHSISLPPIAMATKPIPSNINGRLVSYDIGNITSKFISSLYFINSLKGLSVRGKIQYLFR